MSNLTQAQKKFVNDRKEWSEKQIQLSQLYLLSQILDRTERTRSNASRLVWWLIALPFIVFFAMAFLGLGALAGL